MLRIGNKNGVLYINEEDIPILEEYFKGRLAKNEPLQPIKELLEKQGFERYEGDYINGTKTQHFIKDAEIIQIIHLESAEKYWCLILLEVAKKQKELLKV